MRTTLVVLRHAQAVPAGGTTDHARPLTQVGEEQALAAGRLLRSGGLLPDVVVTSDAARTLRTAELVVAGAAWPVRVEPEVYEASPARLLAVLAGLPPEARTAVLVCHEPGASGLAVALAGPSDDPGAGVLRSRAMAGLRPAQAAVLRWDGGWDDLTAAAAQLVDLVRPSVG